MRLVFKDFKDFNMNKRIKDKKNSRRVKVENRPYFQSIQRNYTKQTKKVAQNNNNQKTLW